MKFGRHACAFLICCLVLLVGATAAHAAEGGSTAAAKASEIFKWINFAILAAGVYWLFGRVLPPAFRRNAENIGSEITKATAVKAEADRLLREAESKLANLEQEVAELRAQAQQESATEMERIRAMTKSESEKITLAANAEIEAAERAARVELKAIAAKLAVDGAESLLAKQLTPQAQEALVANFVKSLESRPN
jgi:F-type H+-transporting ATPase subunit b